MSDETNLADVNATLASQGRTLSELAKTSKETAKGISAFLEHVKSTDERDRREGEEDRRETKKASVIGGTLTKVGGLAVSAGKGLGGLGKSALGKIGALGTGFLGGLLSSKLLRFGIPALGVLFGDEIAEMLTGPDAKQEVKDQVAGAIKGGAIGFLFGPRFAAIGALLGSLMENKEIDKQAGKLVTTLREMGITLPSLSGIFKSINEGVADGLKGINALLKGDFSVDSTVDALKLLGGAAFLISPAGSLFLLKSMAKSPVGRILMGLAAIGYGTGLLGGDDKTVDTSNPSEMRSREMKPIGTAVGDFKNFFKGLDAIDIASIVAGFALLGDSLYKLGKGMYNMFTSSFSKKIVSKVTSSMTSLIKNAAGLGSGFLKGLLNAGRFGMSMVGNLPVLLPLAAMGGLLYVLNNKESSQKLAAKTRGTESLGKATKKAMDEGFGLFGTTGADLIRGKNEATKPRTAIDDKIYTYKGKPTALNLSEYFLNQPDRRMSPGGMSGGIVDSYKNYVTNNQNTAALLGNAVQVGHDIGDQLDPNKNPGFNRLAFSGF